MFAGANHVTFLMGYPYSLKNLMKWRRPLP